MSKVFLGLLALCVFISAVYFKTLKNPLVFDDSALTGYVQNSVESPLKTNPLNLIGRVLPIWSFAKAYSVTTDIIPQRVINLFLHLICTILIFILVSKTTEKTLITFFSAALFGLNPAAIYGVAYLVERSIVMAAMFGIIQIIFCIEWMRAEKLRDGVIFFGLALLAYIFAISSKEHAFPLVVVFPAVCVLSRKETKHFGMYLIAGLIVAGYFLKLAFKFSGHFAYEGGYYTPVVENMCGIKDNIHLRSIATQAGLFFKYMWVWINPLAERSIDMREFFAESILSKPHIYGVVAYVVWGVVSAWFLMKRVILGFAMFVLWCLFLVEIQTIRLGEMFVIYRSYLYAPFYALIFAELLEMLDLNKKSLACIGCLAVFFFGLTTFEDLNQFKSSASLWKRASEIIKPENMCQGARALSNYGTALIHEGKSKEALPILEKAVSLGTYYGASVINAGSASLLVGDIPSAVKYYETVKDHHDPQVSEAARRGLTKMGVQ